MFRLVTIAVSLICGLLFLLLLFFPATYVQNYGVPADNGAIFMVRRASPMFAGLALLLWLVRGAKRFPERNAICWAMIVVFAGIGVVSVFEYMASVADGRILIAAFGEFGIAVLFGRILRFS